MRFSHRISIIIIVLCCVLPNQTLAQHRVINSEINGVPLVRTEGGPLFEGQLFEIESDLVLGVDEGEPEWQLLAALPIFLVAPDGRMILVDYPRLEIFIVSPQGELLSRLGGRGSGPGEFQRMMYLDWFETGRVFQIDDRYLGRVTRYSIDGEYLETISYFHAELYNPELPQRHWREYVPLGNGRILSRYDEIGKISSTASYCHLDSEFNAGEEVIRLISYDVLFRVNISTNNRTVSIPFTRRDQLVTFPDGRFLTTHPSIGRLTIHTPDGDPVLHIERDWSRERLTSDDRKIVIERYQNSSYEEVRDHPQRAPMPRRYPFFSMAITDDRGRIWVQRMAGPTAFSVTEDYTYDVFGTDGVWLGTQVFPFLPRRIRGDYVYRRFLSEAGAPHFERLRLRPITPDSDKGAY